MTIHYVEHTPSSQDFCLFLRLTISAARNIQTMGIRDCTLSCFCRMSSASIGIASLALINITRAQTINRPNMRQHYWRGVSITWHLYLASFASSYWNTFNDKSGTSTSVSMPKPSTKPFFHFVCSESANILVKGPKPVSSVQKIADGIIYWATVKWSIRSCKSRNNCAFSRVFNIPLSSAYQLEDDLVCCSWLWKRNLCETTELCKCLHITLAQDVGQKP